MFFITPSELKTAIYDYQLSEITENDQQITEMAINAAVEEMKSYLKPSNQPRWKDGRPRFDVATIFGASGTDRNPLVLELCKSIAIYYVCRLANVDMIQERVKERYDRAIDWLEKVAGVGKYAGSPSITPDLPVLSDDQVIDENTQQAFRFGSREKFNHDM